jgi:ATP-binding cassette, subfamily B, bacterial
VQVRFQAKRSVGLAGLFRPYIRSFSLALLAGVGQAVADLLEPWPLKVVIDTALRSRPARGWLNDLLLSTFGEQKGAVIQFAALAVLVIAAIGALCSYSEKYLTTNIGQWVAHDLRQTLYSHIQQLSLAYHDRKRTGDLISRLTGDIDAIQSFIASGILSGLINSLALVGMVAVMFYIDWRFTLIALSVAPVLFAVVYRYTRRIKEASLEVRRKEGEIVSVIQEVFSSIRVVKAFAQEEYEQQRLEKKSLESIKIARRARSLKVRLSPFVDMIVAVGTCLVLWFGGQMALRGILSAGSLVLFIWYLAKMYKPMRELSKMTDAYAKATVGYERIRELLQTEHEIEDRPDARQAPKFRGQIELGNVSFSYEPNCPILKRVSLTVEPGQVAALVGPTGAGKTTIINLIPRFYDPDDGTVRIDGTDVKLFRQKSLRQQISFVLQETLLFHGSVWHNIAYGKPDASRDEILRAARLANADEFIERMPQGYNTVIGERGITLSGGQRQRIAIARAVIRNTPIVILDEVSSGLDAASEKLVFEALDRLMKGKTSIVITHRLSTIRFADVIFVVQAGEIVERGNHDELLKNGGPYTKLHELQSGGPEQKGRK